MSKEFVEELLAQLEDDKPLVVRSSGSGDEVQVDDVQFTNCEIVVWVST